jgi:ribosomal protein S6--L-glutamate ligase
VRLVTLNAYRALGIPGARYIKPESLYGQLDEIRSADWVLFPEYWQVNSLIYALKRRIFPNAAAYHLGHDKVEMTRAFWSVCPVHTPQTLILASGEGAVEEALEQLTFPMVAKEPRNSRGNGVFLLETRSALREFAAKNPVLYLQEYLPIRRDLRVVWVGDRVIAAYWRSAAEGSFHNNVAQGGSISFENVPPQALALVERVARELGVDHAGFDLAEVDGHFYFLEFNTLFGNEALNRQGIPIARHIHEYLLGQPQTPPVAPPQPPLLRAV